MSLFGKREPVRSHQRQMPRGPLRGEFAFHEQAVSETERLIPTFRGPEGDHEGMVFLLGVQDEERTIFTSAVAPDADHGPGHVICTAEAVLSVQQAGRAQGLGLLGQVHSHPSASTIHSLGDDDLVLMPFEGMLSIVLPWYGQWGMRPFDSLGVHQFQDGRWVAVERDSIRSSLLEIPGGIDLR